MHEFRGFCHSSSFRPRSAASLLAAVGLLFAAGTTVASADSPAGWTTHRQNNHRNAFVETSIDATSLRLQWEHRSGHRPQPAWHGPAKWDAYSNLPGLHSMRNYDSVFHAVADDRYIYYGSSADGAVYCLDKSSGDVVWKFHTSAAVRIAPTALEGRVFFGSDDGHVYCVDASSGTLVWKFRPREPERLILNNGSAIPSWPIRTGVTIEDGIAYFAASLLPWKESYLCAIDARTGKPEGPGTFVKEIRGQTLEGSFAVTSKFLLAPQGRVPPVVFDRSTGDIIGSLPGGGGSFVVVTPDQQLLYGPGNKAGWIEQADPNSREKIATHNHGKSIAVAHGRTYMLTNDYLAALDYESRDRVWAIQAAGLTELIVVGRVVIAGGSDEVVAFSANDGTPLWSHPIEGQAHGLAFDNRTLLVATDEGVLYAFAASAGTNPESAADSDGDAAEATASPGDRGNRRRAAKEGLIGHWSFTADGVRRLKAEDLAGTTAAILDGSAESLNEDGFAAVEFDGQTTTATIATDYHAATQPTEAFTAEAWVRVDRQQPWGGIVGVIQDNGSDEQGWLLGFTNDRFCFALASERGTGQLTYLKSESRFQVGTWYHVAGVYDGETMRLFVNGTQSATSEAEQGPLKFPEQAVYVIGAYKDKDENFPLQGAVHEVRIYDRAVSARRIAASFRKLRRRIPSPKRPPANESFADVAIGPWLTFSGPSTAIVRWHSDRPCTSHLTLSRGSETVTYESPDRTVEHAVELEGLKPNRTYSYAIHWEDAAGVHRTRNFECDTFFNYTLPRSDRPGNAAKPDDAIAQLARDAVAASGRKRGICIVFAEDSRLAEEIVACSEYRVIICHANDRSEAATETRPAPESGESARIRWHHTPQRDRTKLTRRFANLLIYPVDVAEADNAATRATVFDLVAPGGLAIVAGPAAGREAAAEIQSSVERLGFAASLDTARTDTWLTCRGPQMSGAGEWSHIYGRADNSAFGGEQLGGARTIDELTVQWIGRPGPRYQADRNGRKTPPLSTGGRLYLQGLHRIVTVDIYNGSILWAVEIPEFKRFNVPRDSANWCADEDHLFAAHRDRCWKIDAETGHVEAHWPIPPGISSGASGNAYEWGYIARAGERLVGSAVRAGTVHTNFFGGAGWYDSTTGDAAVPVCSDALFALDATSGEPAWTYRRGVVLNPTITASGERLFFVECRNPTVLQSEQRRVELDELWSDQFLVAIDLASGRTLWEAPIDTAQGKPLFQMAYADERLIVVASSNVQYEVTSFSARDGKPQWRTEFAWGKGKADHGSHLSRPAIVGNRVFVRPAVLELDTGKRLPQEIPVGGCGTYACSSAALLFRSGSGGQIAMWETENGTYTQWPRLRPDCWLSTIPAGGLLLSPEGGGGCSCGKWLETSIGFIPKLHLASETARGP